MTKSRVIFICLFLTILGQSAVDIYLTSMPAIAQSFNTSSNLIQWTLTAYFLSYGFTQLIYGPLSDHFGRKPILIGGMIVYILSSFLCIFAPSALILLCGRFLQGCGTGAANVSLRAIARDRFEKKELARVISFISMAWGSSPMWATALGSYLQFYFSWRAVLGYMLFMGLLGLLLTLFVFQETKSLSHRADLNFKRVLRNYKTLFTDRWFFSHVICVVMMFGGWSLFNTVAPFLFKHKLGLNVVETGWYLLFANSGVFFGAFSNVYLVKHFEMRELMSIGFGMSVVMVAILWILNLFNILSPFAVTLPILGLLWMQNFAYSNCISRAMEPFRDLAGSASAALGAIIFLGACFYSTIAAYLPEDDMNVLVTVLLVNYTICLMLFICAITIPEKRGAFLYAEN